VDPAGKTSLDPDNELVEYRAAVILVFQPQLFSYKITTNVDAVVELIFAGLGYNLLPTRSYD
jgi:hypothetical protein